MKIRYLKLKHWLLASLGSLLGVSLVGCDSAVEYGTPEATYHVKGIVTDTDGNPIPGIGVMEYRDWNTDEGVTRHGDTTDREGSYEVTYSYAFPGQSVSVDFHDVDGAQNGRYRDTTVTVGTDNVPLSGGSGEWYEGEGTITLNVELQPADEQ